MLSINFIISVNWRRLPLLDLSGKIPCSSLWNSTQKGLGIVDNNGEVGQ